MGFQFISDLVALDFINTLDGRYSPNGPTELLTSFEELRQFGREAGFSEDSVGNNSLDPVISQAALAGARKLREALAQIFRAVAQGRPADAQALEILNHVAQEAAANRNLEEGDGSYQWQWRGGAGNWRSPLWPIAWAAAELLTSKDLASVRECGDETCRWLFLDISKNRSRRWCDMKTCGNRNKAKRFYSKRQS